jgi:hypothetical protein
VIACTSNFSEAKGPVIGKCGYTFSGRADGCLGRGGRLVAVDLTKLVWDVNVQNFVERVSRWTGYGFDEPDLVAIDCGLS